MDLCGRNRIFYNRIEQCIGQIHPVLIHQIMKSRYQSECLCISLKMIEVLFHLRTQYHIQSLSLIMQFGKLPHKPVPDRQLPEMPERRIADIMDRAGTFQNMRNILLHLPGKLLIRSTLQDCFTDILSQRLGKRRHFQRMRQSCPYKIALIRGNTCVLSCSLRNDALPYDPMIVLFKLTAEIRFFSHSVSFGSPHPLFR